MKKLLLIENLNVSVQDEHILKNLNLELDCGQIHGLMGPNGSGKTTLAYTLMGHPKYKIISGKISYLGQDLKNLSVDQRAKAGIFLTFQYPIQIEGVKIRDFLRNSYNAIYLGSENELDFASFNEMLFEKVKDLEIDPNFIDRSLNVGFSGGEKKKIEVLQMAVLEPKLVILDEIDSGLDVDALKLICSYINKIRAKNKEMSLLIITHNTKTFEYLKPDFVHIIKDGQIIRSGDIKLAYDIDFSGY
ncbi:MAG: Fe-S cluster assembly ATPase SufC [Candidatus Babeliales bacterium]